MRRRQDEDGLFSPPAFSLFLICKSLIFLFIPYLKCKAETTMLLGQKTCIACPAYCGLHNLLIELKPPILYVISGTHN